MDLPTAKQVKAITDIDAIKGLMDDIELEIVRMETDLEYRSDDEDWERRASAALGIHRYTFRLLGRRLAALQGKGPTRTKSHPRAAEDCDPLTLEVLAARPVMEPLAVETTEEIDRLVAWLDERLNAVTTDREDEIGIPMAQRDERFMVATGNVIRLMKAQRNQLQTRRGQISKALKVSRNVQEERTRERLFIEASREVLDRETYLAIWERVDRMEQQTKVAA